MKIEVIPIVSLVLCLGLMAGCGKKQQHVFSSLKKTATATQLKSFLSEKEAQANAAAKANGQTMPPELQTYFDAANRGDWLAVSIQFNNFMRNAGQGSGKTNLQVLGTTWDAMVRETWGAIEAFSVGDEKYATAFGRDIIASIPPGSIYFGGTEPGRFLITAMQKDQVAGDPFFTLTQNALAAGDYLDYLRSMYGDKIYIPTAEDSQKAFQDYTEDAERRMQNQQLKPGENVRKDPNGRVQVSGQVAVMEVNGLLAKDIFDKNTNQEFYVEESLPLDWMYPYLEPHGLIFKLNRQPLPELSDEMVQRDHDYWAKLMAPMIGKWLDGGTPLADVINYDEKVFARHDLTGFKGDSRFVRNDYCCRTYCWERSNIADLYVWRMNHATTADEKERMAREAGFAFRQALALYPSVQGNLPRYRDFLKSQNRDSDILLLNKMAGQFSRMW